jgi:hypothetical protein
MDTRPENGPFTLEFLSSLSDRRLPLFNIQRVRLLRLDVQEQTLAGLASWSIWWFCQILETSCAHLAFIPPYFLPPLHNFRYGIKNSLTFTKLS